ncbi:MAG: DUF342 domain-containing protein [Clostridia bacterium]|nr:DUF342 domain-containing protein [Clostridia bacterium]
MDLYKFEVRPDGLYVLLTNDDTVKSLEILEKELNLRNIQVDFQDLKTKLLTDRNQPCKLGEIEGIDLGGKFEINLAKDLLTAYLSIFPALVGPLNISLSDVKAQLINKGVTYGVDEVKIMMALAENNHVLDLPIAQGRKPVAGEDAKLKFNFHEKGLEVKPKELENGKVDFYNINLIQIVKKGQLLVEKIPATKGIPGITVTSREIPAKNGKDIKIPLGKNVVVSEDGLKAYAGCDGHVVMADRRVSVLPVYEVNGDVDFSTGNIDFIGNVVIKGNIKEGFSVNSQGDVEVYGVVEGGNIKASGNIFIKKGIRGLKKSKIEAQGNIYSNFVEYASIFAGEDVVINEAIMHSVVNAGAVIRVGGKKGLVVGGTCRAGRALICKNIGSSLATATDIEVGLRPELRLEYKKVCQDIIESQKNYEKTLQAVNLLTDYKKKLGQLPLDKENLLSKLLKTREQLIIQIEDLELYKAKLEDEIKDLDNGYIEVSGTLHSGVNITIGRANKHITNDFFKVRLIQKGVDISISPLIVS